MDLENTAAEAVETETEQEVVEPAEDLEEGSNYQEVAEPESEEVEQSHEDNQKFQAMRHEIEDAQRRAEEAERRLAEIETEQRVREEVYSEYMDDDEDDLVSVLADVWGVSAEEVEARIEKEAEYERLKAENEQFKAEREAAEQEAEEARASEDLANQLAALQKIDPSIKTLADFDDMFAGLSNTPVDYLGAGMNLEQTYWALKAEKDAHKRTPPPEVGGVKTDEPEKPFYTREDVMAMTPAERTKNWKAIRAAQTSGKW